MLDLKQCFSGCYVFASALNSWHFRPGNGKHCTAPLEIPGEARFATAVCPTLHGGVPAPESPLSADSASSCVSSPERAK
jgi:hypothetical protein